MSERRTYEVTIGDGTRRVTVRKDAAGAYLVTVGDGPEFAVDAARPEPGVLSLLLDGRSWDAGLVSTDDGFQVDIAGVIHDAAVVDPMRKALRVSGSEGSAAVRTAMPGRVVRVLVAVGDVVEKGSPLVVVEAMKMENELKAPRAGTVLKVAVSPGQLVDSRAILVELG
jgi:biotin carboxyl carrier protein